MACRFILLAAMLLFFIAQVSSDVNIEEQNNQELKEAKRGLLTLIDCAGLCKGRCRLHSRQNVCTRACGTCCMRCNCVPPGTSGNREKCGPCYTDMTTHHNKTKCP
ncbi:snakin-2-like isoform X2 [Mangifera indica]|uniref:snakin-2-like isoform X2 n=1 Tax=Mangifera indica TaxID=29780 RepID=UPI001CFAC48A|nr:snakin-2-like isoform X2 [Mangifera indica]